MLYVFIAGKMPNLHNIISDIESRVYRDHDLQYEVHNRGNGRWVVYVSIPNGQRRAKLEFIMYAEDDVAGSVIRYGSIPRRVVATIMDSILERL